MFRVGSLGVGLNPGNGGQEGRVGLGDAREGVFECT